MSVPDWRLFPTTCPVSQFGERSGVAHGRTGVLGLLLLILLGSLFVLGVTWKNIEFKRVSINLAQSKSVLVELEKEQAQLSGEIKSLASYPRIAGWAEKELGWRIAATRPRKLVLSRQELSASAQRHWDILRVRDE